MDHTITFSDSVGGSFNIDLPVDACITTSESGDFLALAVEGNTITVKPWRWWDTVMRWNPCNRLVDLYSGG